jgi:hypothetical protein
MTNFLLQESDYEVGAQLARTRDLSEGFRLNGALQRPTLYLKRVPRNFIYLLYLFISYGFN